MPNIAAAGIATPRPIVADESEAGELSDVGDVEGRPEAGAVVAGPGTDDAFGRDIGAVSLAETLLADESAEEILK